VVTRNSTTYETIKKSYKKIGYKQDPRSITYKSPNCFIRIWMRLRCNYPQRQLLFKPQLLQSYFMERPRSTFKKLFQPEQAMISLFRKRSSKNLEVLHLPLASRKTGEATQSMLSCMTKGIRWLRAIHSLTIMKMGLSKKCSKDQKTSSK